MGATGATNSIGLSGYWVPESTGIIPSVSTGWGTSSYVDAGYRTDTNASSASWYVGLQWPDTFIKGNDLGMAVGQAPFVTETGAGAVADAGRPTKAMDSNYMWEWWYKFQVSDNITVTPALFYISDFQGQNGKRATDGDYDASLNNLGGILKTTFKF